MFLYVVTCNGELISVKIRAKKSEPPQLTLPTKLNKTLN